MDYTILQTRQQEPRKRLNMKTPKDFLDEVKKHLSAESSPDSIDLDDESWKDNSLSWKSSFAEVRKAKKKKADPVDKKKV